MANNGIANSTQAPIDRLIRKPTLQMLDRFSYFMIFTTISWIANAPEAHIVRIYLEGDFGNI